MIPPGGDPFGAFGGIGGFGSPFGTGLGLAGPGIPQPLNSFGGIRNPLMTNPFGMSNNGLVNQNFRPVGAPGFGGINNFGMGLGSNSLGFNSFGGNGLSNPGFGGVGINSGFGASSFNNQW